jgi:heme/copper-type cytochrome/quinol oxidase subunit 3
MSAHIVTNTGVDNRKFAMWTLIGSECFLFGTLITNYMINRHRSVGGPTGPEIFDINLTTLSTFDLLISSVAMAMAVYYCKHKKLRAMQWSLAAVLLFGLFFLGFQWYEFHHFLSLGLGLSTNIFGASFYILTGCHGAHVAVGCLIIGTLLVRSLIQGEKWFDYDVVETCGLYWHFVDVIWIIIFTVVYLFVYF